MSIERYEDCRQRFQEAYDALYRVVTGFSIGDCHSEKRLAAMKFLDMAYREITTGIDRYKLGALREQRKDMESPEQKKLREQEEMLEEALRMNGW